MQIRASRISNSILSAISSDANDPKSRLRRILRVILGFFAFFKLHLARVCTYLLIRTMLGVILSPHGSRLLMR